MSLPWTPLEGAEEGALLWEVVVGVPFLEAPWVEVGQAACCQGVDLLEAYLL